MIIKKYLVLLCGIMLALTGCATSSPNIIPENAPSFIVNQPLIKTHSIAKTVLNNFGFNVNDTSDTFIEGYRPYVFGMIMSSGGEKVRVWLESIDPQKTKVTVKTIKQMLGMAGQKRWENDIREEMLTISGT